MIQNYFVYFPEEKSSSSADFEMTGGGHHLHPSQKPYPEPGHPQSRMFGFESGRSIDSFQILWISRGAGIYRDHHHSAIPIQSGQSILLFPGHWHSYRPDLKTGWEEHWIEFRGKRAEDWLKKKAIQTSNPILEFSNDPLIPTFFQELHRLNRLPNRALKPLRNSLALHLIQRLILKTRHTSSGDLPASLHHYRELQEKLGQKEPETSLDHWCMDHGVSYHTFRLWFQKENGISPKQYLSQIRIRKAKEWLLGSSLQIQEIAEKIGYANAFHFSNHFKKETGFTPKTFRNR
ncbi:MAG: AraC family transcriptional regulator [Verrucomicrobiota bacterium]